MSALRVKFAVTLIITIATLGRVTCELADGILKGVSILEYLNDTSVSADSVLKEMNNILLRQEGLQNIANILLENGFCK